MCKNCEMNPADRIDVALIHLRAIEELMLCIARGNGDFHMLSPDNLIALLGGIYDELEDAWDKM